MKKITQLMTAVILFSAFAIINNGCKKSFDQPPGPVDLNIVANTTIESLKSYHTVAGNYDLISEDVIISGIVTANDKSGNLYKQLFIQDETGAIQILVDGYSLYNAFPVGRRVYVKCKGLTLSDANTNMVLGIKATVDGLSSMEGIPTGTLSKYLLGGSLNNPVEPLTVTLADLGTNMSNRYINALVKLEGYEFVPADTSKTYSDTSASKVTQSRQISACNSTNKVTVRNSAYSKFSGVKLPKGNGSITAIYTIFKSSPTSATTTKQLLIRDTTDIQFKGERCDGTTPPPLGTRIAVSDLRKLYTGPAGTTKPDWDIKITTDNYISGIVISDAASKNISGGSFVLQDGNAGIIVYYGGTINYNIGDSVVINIKGDSLLNFRGALEIKKPFGQTPPAPEATGKTITPLVKTTAEINSALSKSLGDPGNLELILVKVLNATASGGTTFSGSRTLTDATGTITVFTSSSATFSGDNLPTGSKNWTGYTNLFNSTKQLRLRNPSDVQ